MTLEFLKDQPPECHGPIMELLSGEALQMAIMLKLDFADDPVYLSNRNIPFVDLKWGHTWGAGAGLLVGLPDVSGGDGQLAPYREYQLGMPHEWIEAENWRAEIVDEVTDVANYRNREAGLYGQIFDPETNQPAGYPFAFDVGLMDKMSASFSPEMTVITLTSESFFARKGAPAYGMQTYQNQQRRFPGDLGMQFTTEAGRLVTWTTWS